MADPIVHGGSKVDETQRPLLCRLLDALGLGDLEATKVVISVGIREPMQVCVQTLGRKSQAVGLLNVLDQLVVPLVVESVEVTADCKVLTKPESTDA